MQSGDHDQPFVTPVAQVVKTTVHGETVFFTVVNRRDEIQHHHFEGAFYEPEELAIIARHFPIGGRFLDIGTNVGNHSLYVAKFLRARYVACFEPNPPAIEILKSNIALNGLERVVDLQYLGIGLSDKAANGGAMKVPGRNLGASRFVAQGNDQGGHIRLERADLLLAGQQFDLIKIDVEGMEIMVLSGMSGLLQNHRPKMFVEVDNANAAAFDAWMEQAGYHSIERFQRYAANVNHLIGPRS